PVARYLPHGLKATPKKDCPPRVHSSSPVFMSQILTSPSRCLLTPPGSFVPHQEPPAEARRRPSGLKATLQTRLPWPLRRYSSRPVVVSQTRTLPGSQLP